MTTTHTAQPNIYPGNCTECGANVPARAGTRHKVEGRWTVKHEVCGTDPQEPATPSTAQTVTPTPEQAECVAKFATGHDLVIQAGAGTGKTSTLLLIAAQAKTQGRKGQYTAFNKAIVEDVASKVPGNITASTMHSMAYRAIGHRYAAKLRGIRQRGEDVARILGIDPFVVTVNAGERPEPRRLAAGFLGGLVMGALKRFATTTDTEILPSHFKYIDGIDFPREDGSRTHANNDEVRRYLLPFAQQAWLDLNDTAGRLRMTHDHYLKMWYLAGPTINADFVMLDEAQDADPVQVAIIEAQRKFGTQIVVVGDSQQVIYEWRGAVNALAQFEEMGAEVAFLTQSFRFGDAVANVANGLLAELGASLRLRGFGQVASVVGPVAEPRAILTRTNAGAVKEMLGAMAEGLRPHLVGGAADIIAFCRAAMDLQAGRRTNYPELACFGGWTEVERYVEEEEDGGDLKLMVKLINEFTASVILRALEAMPTEANADLVISTAHKSKGRQCTSVQIAGDFQPPTEDEPLSEPELRLAYVACTRAQLELDLSNVPHFLV